MQECKMCWILSNHNSINDLEVVDVYSPSSAVVVDGVVEAASEKND